MRGEHPQAQDPFRGSDPHVVQDGIIFKRWYLQKPSDFLKDYAFGQIDRFGTFSFASSLVEEHGNKSGIILSHVIHTLHNCFSRYAGLYRAAGYWGLVDLRLSILNIRKRGLALQAQHTRVVYGGMDFDDSFTFEKRIRADELSSGLEPLIVKIVQELRWAFNVTDKTLDDEFLGQLVNNTIAGR